MRTNKLQEWHNKRIKPEEINKYLSASGKDFIDDDLIIRTLENNKNPDKKRIHDILSKSMTIETLTLDETAALLNVSDKDILEEMREAALKVKLKVYDNRIVTFAPLYLGNECINNCLYCGFKKDNESANRRVLSMEEIRREVEILAGQIGHKRLIVVYGEHPKTGIDYMVDSLKNIYDVKVKTRKGFGQIRRVNVNAAPMQVEELRKLRDAGIGTYQVFQETYHHETYRKLHPKGTIKGNYAWRLYAMHRAFEAGIDDVGIGSLFGLYDWRFEVMGLVAHSRELETRFGIGPHTISFPRMEPADNAPYAVKSPYLVNDDNFKRLMVAIRLSIPHTGMIITARESAQMRRNAFTFGCTQTDASSCIGIGGYAEGMQKQKGNRQQFILGDTRSLDETIREYAELGYITSFCTAGYRCGRTGECIMNLLKTGQEGVFCKLNAILTFREWLDDFASPETKKAGERVIEKELNEVKNKLPEFYSRLMEQYEKTKSGERDLYF
ncbi:MAG: [FeFe] hydrogenase H-cluster radical SAM maturase HydG [Candidatus Omnitrophica bacterium]|jgi:2-iminoacetate synthase|nr:[FeFe] hydrogenase H-cluster radical SAM maturase HydG [Candidatus Omnitrophota bacterium]